MCVCVCLCLCANVWLCMWKTDTDPPRVISSHKENISKSYWQKENVTRKKKQKQHIIIFITEKGKGTGSAFVREPCHLWLCAELHISGDEGADPRCDARLILCCHGSERHNFLSSCAPFSALLPTVTGSFSLFRNWFGSSSYPFSKLWKTALWGYIVTKLHVRVSFHFQP